MKEPRGLAARSTVFAVLLHVVLLGLILVGWRWHRPDETADRAPGALDARMVAFGDLSPATQRALKGPQQAATAPEPLPAPIEAEPLPQPVSQPVPEPPAQPVTPAQPPVVVAKEVPKPTPKAVEKPEPAPVAKPEPVAKPQPAAKSAAAKPTPAQPALPQPDLAAQAAAEAARMTRAANLAKQRAEQLADARSPHPGSAVTPQGSRSASSSTGGGQGAGKTNSGQQKWLDAVARAIEAKWVRPDDIPMGQVCPIRIRIIPGGEVISASVTSDCPYSEEARRSVEKAVRDASPLPFKGYEDVYVRDFTANFKPSR